MWLDLVQAFIAVLAFVVLPFVLITAGAVALMLIDRLAHRHGI